jgi:peptidoglycan/xylan/chitin deacetylase (PgdA/CDA1 family)
LSWEEIQEMSNWGIDFGSHGCSHAYMTRLSRDKIQTELVKSKSVIEEKLSKPVTFFCHPYGDTNDITQRAAKECGYVGAFGDVDFGLAGSIENLYDLTRVGIQYFVSLQDFKAGLVGTYHWYVRLKALASRKQTEAPKVSGQSA